MERVINQAEGEKGSIEQFESWRRHVGICESRYGHDGLVDT